MHVIIYPQNNGLHKPMSVTYVFLQEPFFETSKFLRVDTTLSLYDFNFHIKILCKWIDQSCNCCGSGGVCLC